MQVIILTLSALQLTATILVNMVHPTLNAIKSVLITQYCTSKQGKRKQRERVQAEVRQTER